MSDTSLSNLEDQNVKLRRAVEELSLLNDLAREIGASLDLEDIIKRIIRRALSAVSAEQGMIALVEAKEDQQMKTLVRTQVSSGAGRPFHMDQCLLGWMHLNKNPLLVNDPRNDERFKGVAWEVSIRSILCAPLLVKSKLRGILTVFNKKGEGKFSNEDMRLLAIIAAQSAQVVENARLYEEEQAYFRMQEELKFASEIQHGLLPKAPPSLPGYTIRGLSIPAQQVGGDYFDFVPTEDGRLAFCLGDVSGKGLTAALLMSNLQATIRGQTLGVASAKKCLERSNKLLYHSTDPQKFATVFYGILDYSTHQIYFANAGHDRPILFARDSETKVLENAGVALSFVEHFDYPEEKIFLEIGDLLLLYSDGITETMNGNNEEFGVNRLIQLVKENLHLSLDDLIDTIIIALQRFADDQPQVDDMTLVLIRRE